MISSSSIAYHDNTSIPKTWNIYQSKVSIAQWSERRFDNLEVRGSIPGQCTENEDIDKRDLWIDRESNRVLSAYGADVLPIELDRNWLLEWAAGFGFIVISVCYVMNADQQLFLAMENPYYN